jgi:hypothetical protein
LKKRPDENEYQYIWRLGQAKDSGVLDKDWPSLADVINGECHPDDPRQESAFRKPYQSALLYYNNVFSKMNSDDDYSKQLQVQKDELYILKKQYFDQRREYNKLLDAEARWNHLTDILLESANSLNREKPLIICKDNHITGDKEAVLNLCDWHYGMTTENIFNTYNTQICRDRIQMLVNKVIPYLKLHQIKTLHILLLGDGGAGAIHCGVRVASEEETCDQIMRVSELYAEVISRLADEVEFVRVHSTYGNHLRTIQNKHDSIHSDNMEKLIPWWLKQRLARRDDIEIVESEYFEFIRLNVLGYHVVASHGDLDTVKNFGSTVNNIFTQRYGEVIHYAIMADKHHLEEFDQFGIETILCPSLCGVEEYANTHRLYSKPGQLLMIFSEEEGRECTYNIRL